MVLIYTTYVRICLIFFFKLNISMCYIGIFLYRFQYYFCFRESAKKYVVCKKPAAAVHLFGQVHTPLFFLFFYAVEKNKTVQLSVIRCQMSQTKIKSGSKRSHTTRSSIQDCYRRTEIWSLQDLTLVDGRNPDVVNNQI